MEVFQEMKTQGIPLPVMTTNKKGFLSYEESKNHPDRFKEVLPKTGKKDKKPPFSLNHQKARCTINCDDCHKPREVFSQKKPEKDLQDFIEISKEGIWNCGSSIQDMNPSFAVNENLDCKSSVEQAFYGCFCDKIGSDLVCHGCGLTTSPEMFSKYCEDKKTYATVSPTCGTDHCLMNESIKWINKRPRKPDQAHRYANKLSAKSKTLELLLKRKPKKKRRGRKRKSEQQLSWGKRLKIQHVFDKK